MNQSIPRSIEETQSLLSGGAYIADRPLATILFLALKMERPLLLEGEAGVGKTEISKVLSQALGRKLIRLQCYEGLDTASAVYEWNYQAQMMEIRLAEAQGNVDRDSLNQNIFSERFLTRRPLLQSLEKTAGGPPVLLIDELDRTDEPFEAYLLELLSDYQVTIPEIGAIKATARPIVIITSNRTREIHDALKRRCLYHWVDYPDQIRELEILRLRLPQAANRLTEEIVRFVHKVRSLDLYKHPGVAESIDWATALTQLDAISLSEKNINDTLGALLKYQEDIARVRNSEAARLLQEIRAAVPDAPRL